VRLPLIPPHVEVTPELLWVLSRAFSPLGSWSGPLPDRGGAWRLAEALDLSCRIGWRVPRTQLAREVGEEVASKFVAGYHDAAASALLIRAVAQEVASELRGAGFEGVLLKSNALALGGITAFGARRFMDVDILVPQQQAHEVRGVLVAKKYRSPRGRDGAHQLSSLFHPTGVMVEIHTHVKHMRLAHGEGWMRFEDLERGGLLHQLPGMAGIWIPSLEFLAGHALVHGVVQHWRQVGDYPLMRLPADLQDIEAGWQASSRLEEAIAPWLAAEKADVEGQAVMDLIRQLGAGVPWDDGNQIRKLGGNLFLRHVVATRFDREYQDAVRAASILWVDANRSHAVALARKLRNRLCLSPSSVRNRYGVREGNWVQILVSLWRPFDLAGKFCWLLMKYLLYRWRWSKERSIAVTGG